MNNSNTPASPTTGLCEQCCMTHNSTQDYQGLSKREHFAGLAMQGLLSNPVTGDCELWETPQEWVKQMAEVSVEMADALLKELSNAS